MLPAFRLSAPEVVPGCCVQVWKRGASPNTLGASLVVGVQDPGPAPYSSSVGLFQGPDLCCREHDRCPQTISPFQYNYGILNHRFHTVSHCDCDARLAGRADRL